MEKKKDFFSLESTPPSFRDIKCYLKCKSSPLIIQAASFLGPHV